jgi:hypothetical protein
LLGSVRSRVEKRENLDSCAVLTEVVANLLGSIRARIILSTCPKLRQEPGSTCSLPLLP